MVEWECQWGAVVDKEDPLVECLDRFRESFRGT